MNQKQAYPLAFLPMTGTRSHLIAVPVNWLGQAGLSGMSMTGGDAGTPVFMPREQITNFKYVKPESDVWSMGATIHTHHQSLPMERSFGPNAIIPRYC